MRIIVIDDEKNQRDLLAGYLKKQGHDVRDAESGPLALKMLAEKGYDTTFGARPLKRIIQNMILDELALEIIEGKIKEGDKIFIDLGIKDKVMMKKK